MLTILYIILLSAACCWLLRRIVSDQPVTLSTNELVLAFGVKVLAGAAYGYIFYHFFGGDDTWLYHRQGLHEKDLLLLHPGEYFSELNPLIPFHRNATFSAGLRNLFWDLEYNLTVKPQAFFNLISGGNYYINIVFFSFITFWGHYWFFSLLTRTFPEQRKKWLLLVFFFPPLLFWLSGYRGDGLLFFFTSLVLLQGHRWLKTRSGWALTWIITGLSGALIMRAPAALLLLPALLSVVIAERFKVKTWKSFALVYAIGLILVFGSDSIIPSVSPVKMVTGKQAEFFALQGNTRFQLDTLQPTPGSFLRVLPQAALNVFFRPFPWEAKGPLQLVSSADTWLFWVAFIWMLFRYRDSWSTRFSHPLLLFLLISGATLFIFIGYTVPFPGAIVRYKAIPELFLWCWLAYTHNKKLHI